MLVNSTQEEDIKDKRKGLVDKDMEHFIIKKVDNILDIGKIIKCMVKEHFIILTIKLLIKETGLKIDYGAMELYIIKILNH
jgi:hypothetical protein